MKNILLVPIRTDALFLSEDTMVADATADFSRLPYFNGTRDVNADVANVSENVISQPLQSPNLRLRKGLHLHWALPDALNRGSHQADGKTDFPVAPNRWLVTRRINDEEKSWVVESDYLFPEEKKLVALAEDKEPVISEKANLRAARKNSITVPVKIGGRESGEQPFRYMGRKLIATAYDPKNQSDRYEKLTTVGYGEPSFAAFYPNCHSVFGFHDEEIGKDSGIVTYDIIGWYSKSKDDFFKNLTGQTVLITQQEFIASLPDIPVTEAEARWKSLIQQGLLNTKTVKKFNSQQAFITFPADWPEQSELTETIKADSKTLLKALEKHVTERAKWALQPATHFEDGTIPGQTVLFSSITIDAKTSDGKLPQEDTSGISVVIGQTGTEALSAYLGLQLSGKADIRKSDPQAKIFEEQLEALYLLDKLDHRILDLDAKFDEARHENGFNAIAGGQLWTISIESSPDLPADADKEASKPKISAEIADLLNQANGQQILYDRSEAELKSLGTQLFADWYKYMLSTYPPQDTRTDYPDMEEVRYFIQEQVMKPLKEKEAKMGQLVFETPEEIEKGKLPASGTPGTTAEELANVINQLLAKLTEENRRSTSGSSFVLKQVGGPRYYQPREPVLLLANKKEGDSILKPTIRHGQDGIMRPDGLLDVHVVNVEEEAYLDTPGKLEKLRPEIELLGDIGHTQWDGQPWNPFRLDWELELAPQAAGTNIKGENYEAALLKDHFKLALNAPDLAPKQPINASPQGHHPNIYVGKSLLTPQAKRNLFGRLEAYLKDQLPAGFDLKDEALAKQKAVELGEFGHPVATALSAYHFLQKKDLHLLSQAFSGFNDAMLQLRQTLQLPIADPIGFLDYQAFTEEVARLAENSTHLAPQPLTDFIPICTGKLIINQLRLVDTFGQVRDIELGTLDRVLGAGPTPTTQKDSKIEVPLLPRLAQPARLNFRWLNAQQGSQEMNAAPSTSPICGWIMTNQLDDSLVIYDANGEMLGSIEAEDDNGQARWNSAPGALVPFLPEAIKNQFLKKMVAKIREGGASYVADFINGMNTVLENIEPEESESQQALSLLIGRPVALVRALINLELQSIPAVDQGWRAFYDDRKENDTERKRDDFTKVKFPIRLGKHNQFNDGLVGYWKETAGGELENDFLLHQTPLDIIEHPRIKMLEEDEIPIFQSLDDAPQFVSMLMDPRAKVHATTGILPVKDISLPADQYLPAMQRMGVTFLTSPLLSPAANIQSLLPTVEGLQWSWIEKQTVDHWREVFPFPTIERSIFVRVLAQAIIRQLESLKWLQPSENADAYEVLPEEGRQPLTGQFEAVAPGILSLFMDPALRLADDTRLISKKAFQPVGLAWDLLVRSDIGWCRFIPDREDLFIIQPVAERKSPILEGIGMEFLVEEILQTHVQILSEPRMDAHFNQEKMTIREGYLTLKAL